MCWGWRKVSGERYTSGWTQAAGATGDGDMEGITDMK